MLVWRRSKDVCAKAAWSIVSWLCLSLLTSAYLCLPLLTFAYLCLPLLTFAYLCLPLLSSAYLCLLLLLSLLIPSCVLLVLTGPYWALLGLTWPYWALLDLTRLYLVLLSLLLSNLMTRQGPFYHYDWTLRRVLPLTALTDLLNAESFVMRTLDVWRDWTRNCEHTEATFFHSVDVGAGGWGWAGWCWWTKHDWAELCPGCCHAGLVYCLHTRNWLDWARPWAATLLCPGPLQCHDTEAWHNHQVHRVHNYS